MRVPSSIPDCPKQYQNTTIVLQPPKFDFEIEGSPLQYFRSPLTIKDN